jgi:peptidoglycan-associated lipoprotein
VIRQGQTTVPWQSDNATESTIEAFGLLPASGSKTITPTASTTFTLVAKGPGGTQDASARVAVTRGGLRFGSIANGGALVREEREGVLVRLRIRRTSEPIKRRTRRGDAAFLLQHPSIKVVVEGHCDDRGSEEYNLALGTSRAESLKPTLLLQGVSEDRIKAISYGKRTTANAGKITIIVGSRIE